MSERPVANEAFWRWIELTGVDRAHFEMGQDEDDEPSSYTLDSYDATKAAVAIHEALGLDDGELTAAMLMERDLAQFMEHEQVTLAQLAGDIAPIQRKMTLCREIQEILGRDGMVRAREAFTRAIETSLEHYGAMGRGDVRELLEDTHELAGLRRDALGSLGKMRCSQFLDGPAGEARSPQYSTVIRRWWSVDQMLAAHACIPEGVTLNLVATPAAQDTFFCFAVRRGARLYLLDDAPEYAHPLESQMSRSPGRRLAERVGKFWFPYDLAQVAVGEDGKSVRRRGGRGGRQVSQPRGVDAVSQVVGQVADLGAHELVWTAMMFDLIAARFFSAEALPQLEMSHTGGQLAQGALALEHEAAQAGLPVAVGTPAQVAVPAPTREEVSRMHLADNAEQVLGETGNIGSVAWMQERYGPAVPEEVFGLVAPGSALVRLGHDGAVEQLDDPDHEKIEQARFFNEDTAIATLKALDTTTIGTAAELAASRGFLARYNYAQSINALAGQEFEQREEQVRDWLAQAYTQRLDFLLTLAPAAREGIEVADWEAGQGPAGCEFHGGLTGCTRGSAECGHQHTLVRLVDTSNPSGAFFQHVPAPRKQDKFHSVCPVTGSKPSFYLQACPTNSAELAWILGKSVDDLPDVLQHLCAIAPGHGNSILDRIDPMLWVVENPWHKLRLGVIVPLSKRGLAKLEKDHPGRVDLSHLEGVNLAMFNAAGHQAGAKPARRRR